MASSTWLTFASGQNPCSHRSSFCSVSRSLYTSSSYRACSRVCMQDRAWQCYRMDCMYVCLPAVMSQEHTACHRCMQSVQHPEQQTGPQACKDISTEGSENVPLCSQACRAVVRHKQGEGTYACFMSCFMSCCCPESGTPLLPLHAVIQVCSACSPIHGHVWKLAQGI